MIATPLPADPRDSTRPTVSLPLLAAVLAAAGLAAFSIDLPVARWWAGHRLPGELDRFVNLSEAVAHGLGAGTILLAAYLLDPGLRGRSGRRPLWAMLAGAFGGGLSVYLIKAAVDRVRPRAADLASLTTAAETFARPDGLGGSDLHSFPSGHSAVAAGLAAVLSWRYPAGRWLFSALATTACLQRLASSAHYPSDVCFGAALGLLVTWAALRWLAPSGGPAVP